MIQRASTEGKSISTIRIISMCMVLVCHIARMIPGMQIINQSFGSATFTFLFISGVLYGCREYRYDIRWFLRQYEKIIVPVAIWTIVLAILNTFLGNPPTFAQLLVNVFGGGLFGAEIQGGGHLYFVSIIILCYAATLGLNKLKNPVLCMVISTVSLSACGAIVVGQYSAGRAFVYINTYVVGFLWARYRKGKSYSCSVISFIILSVLTLGAWVVRLLLNLSGADDSYFYCNILSQHSGALLGVWLFFCLYGFFCRLKYYPTFFKTLDKLSYEVYIVHFCIIVSPLSIMKLPMGVVVNVILAFAASFVLAVLLNFVSALFKRREMNIYQKNC